MNGKIVGVILLGIAVIAGAAMYYLQVYAFYEDVSGDAGVQLVSLATGEPEQILFDRFQAIDADSSPIRYRACFETASSLAMLTESYQGLNDVTPRVSPGWFDCFDAEVIAEELEAGTALAFLGQKNINYGVDRIVVITEDGRGYIWHELNACGSKAYDGSVIGEECPPRPEGQ